MTFLRRFGLLSLVAIVATAALSGTALAASTTSIVTATVGSEVSLAVGTPAVMSLSHSTPATSSSLVTVTSTQPSWTLSIADANTGANAGHMLNAVGGAPLAGALQWSKDGSTFSDLSATPATAKTGSLVDTQTVWFRQALGATEDVTLGDLFQLTVGYTVA
jgi:hypothetical protein